MTSIVTEAERGLRGPRARPACVRLPRAELQSIRSSSFPAACHGPACVAGARARQPGAAHRGADRRALPRGAAPLLGAGRPRGGHHPRATGGVGFRMASSTTERLVGHRGEHTKLDPPPPLS